MKKTTMEAHRHVLGIILIVAAIGLLIYDFYSPPVGELSNFTLIIFAKLIAIAGALMNIKLPTNTKKGNDDESI